MNEVLHIIKFKIKSALIFNLDFSAKGIIKNLATIFVYALFTYGIYNVTFSIIENILTQYRLGEFLLHRFIAMILFVFFLAVNAGNIVVSLSTLYKSKEVNFFFSTPIKYENIFIIKFLDNFFYSSITLIIVLLSVVAGYANYFKLGIDFYLFALFLIVIPFILIAALFGAIVLLLLIKVASKIGLKISLIILVSFYLISLIVFFNNLNPMSMANEVLANYPYINFYFGYLDTTLVKVLPNFWVSEALYWYLRSDYEKVFSFTYLILSAAFVLFVLLFSLAKKFYRESYFAFSDLRLTKRENFTSKNFLSLLNISKKNSQISAILRREFFTFFREPSQLVHAAVMVFLIFIFLISFTGIDLRFLGANPEIQTMIYLIIFLFNCFLISSITLRFVFPLISLEGETFWKLISSPFNLKKLVVTKFLVYTIILLIVSLTINTIIHFVIDTRLILVSTIIIIFVTVTLTAINLGFGGLFANFKEKNPIRISSSQGASTAFLISLVYLGLVIAILFAPIFNYFYSFYFDIHNYTPRIIIPAVVAIVTISIPLIILFIIMALKSVHRDY